MAMEVVRTRAFTPVLKTQVYSFGLIIFAYLGATFCGSLLYRRGLRTNSVWDVARLMSVAVVATFLPILFNDLRFLGMAAKFSRYLDVAVLLFSITPLCAVLGYLTPSLIDKDALGDPADAGNAYALNVLGCILGPLFASYLLLPWVGERYGLVLLGLPFLGFYFFTSRSLPSWYRGMSGAMAAIVLAWSLVCPVDFGSWISRRGATEIRRDYAASVISAGKNLDKHLFVNGIGVTSLTPETKFKTAPKAKRNYSGLVSWRGAHDRSSRFPVAGEFVYPRALFSRRRGIRIPYVGFDAADCTAHTGTGGIRHAGRGCKRSFGMESVSRLAGIFGTGFMVTLSNTIVESRSRNTNYR